MTDESSIAGLMVMLERQRSFEQALLREPDDKTLYARVWVGDDYFVINLPVPKARKLNQKETERIIHQLLDLGVKI